MYRLGMYLEPLKIKSVSSIPYSPSSYNSFLTVEKDFLKIDWYHSIKIELWLVFKRVYYI